MLLTGSFEEYPLVLLLEIFLHRRETGLLEVSSPKQSGYFYLRNGEIKDGEVGTVRGAAAIELARSFVDASFQFKRLKPTDYAQIVWEKNFGPNRLVADSPRNRVRTSRTAPEQLRRYPVAVYGILERAVVSLAQRALRHFLFFIPAAYHSLHKTGVFVARRILACSTLAYEFSRRAQFGRKLGILLVKALAGSQIALRCSAELILKYAHRVSFQRALTLIRERVVLPSRQQVAESNISFGLILLALVAIGAVSISKILRMDQDDVNMVTPSDEDTASQSQPPKQVSRSRRKEKPRIGRQNLTVKRRGVSLPTETTVLPERAAVALVNAVSDSDIPKKELVPKPEMQTIAVVVQVENGRVSQASLLERRPGMECYEAAALRIARQRRYAKAGKHTEIVEVKVAQPKQ